MITVSELIAKLSTLNPDLYVVMSKDAEGNDFSPLQSFEVGTYIPSTTWAGDFVAPDEDEDYSNEGDAICLWPVN